MYDIIIIGCGPAGMSAAIYALRDRKKVLILEKETIGGKISSSPMVENYPGFNKISGAALADNLYEQIINLGAQVEIEEVTKIVPGKIKKVITTDNEYQTKSIIIASGSNYRTLGLPKEEEFIGNGISFCTICDGPFHKGKDVAVVGGGNSAIVSALSLADICKRVYLIVRKDALKGSLMQLEELKSKSNVVIYYNATIKELMGEDELEKIKVLVEDKEVILEISALFLAIGQIPATEFLANIVELSSDNYINANEDCLTNLEGIYVAGDVRNKKIRQLTTAVNDGTIAALNCLEYLKKLN